MLPSKRLDPMTCGTETKENEGGEEGLVQRGENRLLLKGTPRLPKQRKIRARHTPVVGKEHISPTPKAPAKSTRNTKGTAECDATPSKCKASVLVPMEI